MPIKNESLYLPSQYGTIKGVITSAQSTNYLTLATIPLLGINLLWLAASTDDTQANVLYFAVSDGVTDYPIGSVAIPALSGTSSSAPIVSCLTQGSFPFSLLDNTGLNRYLPFEGGLLLKVKAEVAVTSTKFLRIIGQYGDYTEL